jgi:copper chaperone CopZ
VTNRPRSHRYDRHHIHLQGRRHDRGHCVSSVQNEVSSIPGVTSVDVDLTAGQVTVTSDSPIDSDAVRSAVEEAGYEVVT